MKRRNDPGGPPLFSDVLVPGDPVGTTDAPSSPVGAEARYRALFESARDAILVTDGDGRYIDANHAATELLGYERAELLSMRVADLVAQQREWTEDEFRRFLDEGRWTGEIELRRKDGSVVEVEATAGRVDGAGGPIHVSTLRDLTDRNRARQERAELLAREREARGQAEAARQRVRLVSDASELLAVAFEYPGALIRLANLMVLEVADLCLIDIVDERGVLIRVAAVHANQSKQALADRLARRYSPLPGMSDPVTRTFLTGEPHHASSVTERVLRDATADDGRLHVALDLGVQSFMSVPLMARGRTLGVLTLLSTNPDIRYGEPDVRLAEEIARRVGVRIDNARLYEERDRTAKVLQRSLLPPDLPVIPHVDLAARYLPVGEGNEVGGDFYDVFDSGDGTWGAVVGDVCGKGPEAAAVMGLVRHTLRALARFQRRPSKLLRELNRSLLEQSVDERFCTVCYLRMRPSADGVRVTLCAAGHPLPFVLRTDGRVEAVGRPGHLLGLFPEVSLADSAIDLASGDALVIYTDGAIDERIADPVTGERRLAEGPGDEPLRRAVAAAAGCDAEGIAARIEEALQAARGVSPPVDDVALLVIRAADVGDPQPAPSSDSAQ
jgi:PAS domain S-box-containing protein